MSSHRDTTRIVRSWLDEGATTLPDRVLDAVLDELPATPQRRVTWWPARRLFEMNKAFTYGVAAAAFVVIAILGTSYFAPTGPDIGGPPEPLPTPTSTPEPEPLFEGSRGPGTFSTEPSGDNPDENPPQITFDMPEDWSAVRPFLIGTESEAGSVSLLFLQPSGLYSDPCLANSGTPDVPVGSTADEFASALVSHTAYEATAIGDAVIGGHDAIRMELQTPSDIDYTACESGQFWVWDAPLYSEGPNSWNLWILDLGGTTVVLLADITGATADQVDQVEGIVQSIQIEP